MKEIVIITSERCPYCRQALEFLEALRNAEPVYQEIPLRMIHEEDAGEFDYFFIHAFFIEGRRLHEGGITKEELRAVLEAARVK